MRFTLPPRLVGTFTAAALAVTTLTAAPAFADNDRAARTIATLFGLAVVGAIINDNRQDKKRDRDAHNETARKQSDVRTHRHGTHTHKHANWRRAHNNGVNKPHHPLVPKPLPRRVNRKLLPQKCFRSFDTRRGKVRMFARRCLERNYRFVNRLPQNCFQRVRTYEGKRAGFGARCLRQNGYRLARR